MCGFSACCIVCGVLLRRRPYRIGRFCACREHQRGVGHLLWMAAHPNPQPIVVSTTPDLRPAPSMVILIEVANKYGITLEKLRAPGRSRRPFLRNRTRKQITMFEILCEAARRLRLERGLTLNQIGRYLGGRDHSTILRMVDDAYRQRHIERTRLKMRGWRQRKLAA